MDVHKLCTSQGLTTLRLVFTSTIDVVGVLFGHRGWYLRAVVVSSTVGKPHNRLCGGQVTVCEE